MGGGGGGSCNMIIYSLILLCVNTGAKSYILPLQEVIIDIIVNFYPEMITATLVNALII